jgi:catechol 2,3-dioxygenase-like lactoylglutathione lyase family enzyme
MEGRHRSRRAFIRRAIATPLGACALSASARAQSPGRVAAFDHVALPMQETEKMAAFYERLGFRTEKSPQLFTIFFGEQKVHFHMPAFWRRETFTLRGPTAQPGCGDLCFVWEGGSTALKETLDRAGATIIEGPVPRPGGRNGGKAMGTSVYVRDPDGNLLEFMIY